MVDSSKHKDLIGGNRKRSHKDANVKQTHLYHKLPGNKVKGVRYLRKGKDVEEKIQYQDH